MKILELLIAFAICMVLNCVKGYCQYSYADVQGIWKLESVATITDCPQVFNNRFFIFNRNKFVFIPTLKNECSSWNDFMCFEYGFTDDPLERNINNIHEKGEYITYADNDGFLWSECTLDPEDDCMYFYGWVYYRIGDLPKYAQIVLYENSQKDYRNYAREFLDYDICGIKSEGCQLLDSLQQPTSIAIPKGDIVVVRDTCGDVLQVEYEPEPGKYVSGYLKRNDLEFVEVKTEN